MEVLVTYDVSTETKEGRKRLRKVAITCQSYGQRVQQSVFECRVTEAQLEALEYRLLQIINPEQDSLRIYRLSEPRARYVRLHGTQPEFDLREPLII